MNCESLTDLFDWWNTGRVSAAAAVVAATAAIIAAASGVRTLRQNRRDSRARSRPMLAAELRGHPYAKANQILVIRNYGPAIARNVEVMFDPEIPDPGDPSTSVTPFLKHRYEKPISVVTPGMELDNVYFAGRPSEQNVWVNVEPTPAQVRVTIRYQGDDQHKYEDFFDLDTQLLRDRTYTTSSASPESILKEISKTHKEIRAELRSWRTQE